MFFEYVAIDPLALLLPNRIYVITAEKLHPHVPKVAEIQEAMSDMTPEERTFVVARARALGAYAKAVEEAAAAGK
jgi:hypothetical protein